MSKVNLRLSYPPYQVDDNGNVFYNEQLLETTVIDSHVCVKLNWIYGEQYYRVALLVIVAFMPMYLPRDLLKMVEPRYLDNNYLNVKLVNLSYHFRGGPLQVPGMGGFYYIPFFTHYAINEDGVLVNATRYGKELKWSLVPPDPIRNATGGYAFARVTNVPGVSGVLYRHRAMCLALRDYPLNIADLVVNHINGRPGDDRLDNLEWNTYAENLYHSRSTDLQGSKRRKVLVKHLDTGKIRKFDNTVTAARELGLPDNKLIRYRLKHAPTTVYTDYLLFKWDDGNPWPDIDITSVKAEHVTIGSRMIAKNIFTEKVVIFDTFEEGSLATGLSVSTIVNHTRNNLIIPFKGWHIHYYRENLEWPIHHEVNIKAYEFSYGQARVSDPFVVTNVTTNEETIFFNRYDVMNTYSIDYYTLTDHILTNTVFNNTYTFGYHSIRDNIKVPSSWNT